MISPTPPENAFRSLSVVVPCFNEAENLIEIRQRILKALESLSLELEVIFVDDGSTDRSWSEITALTGNDSRFRGIRLSRNFGQQEALLAGLSAARGELVVTLDADLQDPPESIAEMIRACERGAYVVYGVRKRRKHDPALKKLFAALFYAIIRRATGLDIPGNVGEFRLARREVVLAVLSLNEPRPFLRGMFAWVGFSRAYVYYERPERFAGAPKFTFRKSLSLALDAFVSYSSFKAQIELFLGMLALLSGCLGAILLFIFGTEVWIVIALIICSLFLIGGWLVTKSFLDLDARIGSRRPASIVQERVGRGLSCRE